MHRLHLLRALLHPSQVRDALRPTRASGTLPGALRCGLSVALALALVAAAGRRDVAGFAALGALTSLYGRSSGYAWRARLMGLAGAALTAAVTLSAALSAAQAPVAVQLAALAAVAVVATAAVGALRTGPPGATIVVFAAGAGGAAASGVADVAARGTAVAVGAALAWVVCCSGAVLDRARGRVGDRAPRVAGVVRAGLSDGDATGTAVTVGVAALLAATAATAAGWGHPAWAVMGATAVLQGTHVRHMGVRALQRAGGTACGALLAAPLLGAHLGFWAVAALVVALQVVTELVVARHYGLAMLAITPMALLMTSVGGATDPGTMALDRALDTVAGAVIGLLVAVAAARPDAVTGTGAPATAQGSEVDALQHLRHQGRDGRPLGPGQGHVREQRVPLQRLDDRGDAVVPADAQVVPLGDVVRQHHP